MTSQSISTDQLPRQLAERGGEGVTVELWWTPVTNRLAVTVCSDGSGDAFELSVGPGEALDAFNHPYAYAARRGVDSPLAA